MVCQACRNVETVDVGVGDQCLGMVDESVGDDLIMVQKVDVGVGDGPIDPLWLSTEIPIEEKCLNLIEKDGTKTEEPAAPIEEKEIRNKSRKQCKPRKICNVPKQTEKAAQPKPLKLKIKFKANIKSTPLNKVTKSKSTAAKAKLNSSDEIIVETSSSKAKSQFRLGKSKNISEKFKVPSPEPASSTEKSAKTISSSRKSSSTVVKTGAKASKPSSTPVKAGSKSGKRSSSFDEGDPATESSSNECADDASDSDKSNSENEDEDSKASTGKGKPKRIRTFKLVECNICGRGYKINHIKRHMKTHEEDEDKKKPHQCDKCGKKFTDFHYRNNHQMMCGKDSQLLFQCHICERSLGSKKSLELHIESHSNERSFQCHLCAKLFKSYSSLYNHIKTHSELQPFACDQCDRRFKLKRSLMYHKVRFHEGKVGTYKCELCEKVFNHRDGLKAHMDQHRGIKNYTCEVCGKRFGRHSNWRIHLRIHNDTKTYSCSECGKGFNQKGDLKRHMSTHTGVKPFKCEECGKQFIHRVYLARHQCSGTKEPSENTRKTHQRETRNGGSNNEMLSNLAPIIQYGHLMTSGEMYDLMY